MVWILLLLQWIQEFIWITQLQTFVNDLATHLDPAADRNFFVKSTVEIGYTTNGRIPIANIGDNDWQ